MGIVILTKQFIVPKGTGTGNFDFTTLDLNGLTPKGVIVRVHRGGPEVDRINLPGYGTNWGAYDGTNQTALSCHASSGQEPGGFGNVLSVTSSTNTVKEISEGGVASSMSVTGSGLIKNGVRLNLLDSDSGQDYTFDIIFFAGTDMQFATGTGTFDSSLGFATSFEPEAAIFASLAIPANSTYSTSTNPTDQRWMPSMGFACQTPTGVVQVGFMAGVDELNPIPAHTPRVLFDGIAGFLNPDTQIVDASVTVASFNPTGITISPSLTGPESGLEAISWAAFSTGGIKTWDIQTLLLDQTVSTTVEQTGVGFKPDGVFFLPSSHTAAVDSVETDVTGWGMTFSDGGNEGGHCFSAVSESAGNDDVNGKHRMETRAIASYTASGGVTSIVSKAYVSEFGSDGFTLGIEANSGVSESHKIPFMTFGETAPASVTTDGQIAFASDTARTTTGNQSFTAPLGGVTPKGAWLFWVRAGEDTAVIEAAIGTGFVDSEERQFTTSMRSQDGASTTTHGFSVQEEGRCINMLKPGSVGSEGVAEFVSFSANTITVNWTAAPPTGWIVRIVLFAGTDVETAVRTLEFRSQALTRSIACGFDPDFTIMTSDYGITGVAATGENVAFATAYMTNKTTPDTIFTGYRTSDFSGMTRTFYLVDDSIPWEFIGNTGSTAGTWTEQFKAAGLKFSRAALSGDQDITVFCVRMPGASFDARVVSLSAPTGSQSITGLGFGPTHLISFLGGSGSIGALINFAPDNESTGWGFFNGVSRQMSLGISSDAGLTTTETWSYSSDNRWLKVFDGTGVLGSEVEVTSVDADGFTVNKINMTTGAIVIPTLSIGAPVAGVTTKTSGNWL